ncbi:putative Histidine kinase [Desulfamplus magnetovallimortis]|uniref:histidine kinase n=1 Tax=Desulfamplus magnetovallimortis TaxID=1246637 RepID=A0A1W1H7G3_9BACT|nr:response regulator [Desulfamplus magnetovallimortis]SLM28315.1 putative Histidine kinase [Desulfamplus magnetovallimortis]
MTKDAALPKILIVDDIPENLFVLEKILGKLEVNIISASSGNEALAHVLDHDFALIILDIQMPEMDGYEVAEILKFDEATANIPIIFVTAIDRDTTKEMKGYDTGAVDFIFKPLNKFILLSKVKVFLELYKIKTGLEQMVMERTLELNKINKSLIEQIEKNAEAAREIEKGRAYLSKVINTISSCLISVDDKGCITDMNIQAQKISGISAMEAKGEPVSKIFPFYVMLMKNVKQAIESDAPVEKSRTPVYIKGKLVINNFFIYPFSFNDNMGAVIRVDDVTERVKMDEIVIQSEKMLSMGGIAAGMAQEMNNPLAGIIQNIQVIRNRIQKKLPANESTAVECGISFDAMGNYLEKRGIFKMIDAVHQSGKKAACIVEDMLNFSRKSEGYVSDEEIVVLVDKSVKIALNDHMINSDTNSSFTSIEINRNYQENLPRIPCQAGKIQQVILNILKNGIQAMETKSYEDGDKKRFDITIRTAPNDMICILISDNGHGMSETISKKIFEPFFTTKKNCTGLGLSIAYFIITEDHKGYLSVSSDQNKGTTFTIRLPMKKVSS